MPFRVHVSWSPELVEHDFGLGHPMAPLRLDLTVRLAQELGLLAHDDVTVVGAFPASSHPPITYPAALLTGAADEADRAFYDALSGDGADAIFARHGFTVAD